MNRRQFIALTGVAGILAACRAPAAIPFAFGKFNPLSVPSMAIWLPDANYGVTLDGSNRASSVIDRSGQGHTWSGAGTTKNPLVVANAYNGWPCYRFTTAAQSSFNFSSFNPSNNWFAIMAVKTTGSGVNAIGWTQGGVNRQIIVSAAEAGVKAYDGTNIPISNAVNLHSGLTLVAMQSSAGTCSVWRNGAAVTMTLAGTLTTSMTSSSFGQVVNAAWSDMDVTEAMLYTAVPTAGQIASLFEYFRAKYAIY